MIFAQTLRNILGDFTESKTEKFQKGVEYVPKICSWALLCFFFLVVTKEICFENLLRSLYLEQYVFFVQMQSRFGCASFRRLGSVLWLFTSCVWDVLWHRILKKTALVSWAKQKLSKTSLSTFQNRLFELWWACCFGCNWKSCFENFVRSLYSEQYVFFVQMQSHVSAALNFEGYVWSFGSLHPAFEMSCENEYP